MVGWGGEEGSGEHGDSSVVEPSTEASGASVAELKREAAASCTEGRRRHWRR